MAKSEAKVTADDFIKSLQGKKKLLAAAAKTKVGSFLEESDIIEKYDLTSGKVTLNGKLAKVAYGWAKQDKKRPYLSFYYMVDDGTMLPSVYREFSDEKGAERAMGELQRLGVDTTVWDESEIMENMVKAAIKLTKTTPEVSLTLGVWGDDDDRLNIGVKLSKTSNEDEGDDEDEDEDEPKSKKSSKAASAKSSGGSKSKAKAKPEPEDEDEDGDDGFDHDDPSTWIDYECSFKIGKKTLTGVIKEYDEDDESFTVEDSDEEEHQVSVNKVTLLTE